MDRAQLLLVGLPLFLFCSDIVSLFSPPPAKPATTPLHHHHHHHHQSNSPPLIQQQQQQSSLEFPSQVRRCFNQNKINSYLLLDLQESKPYFPFCLFLLIYVFLQKASGIGIGNTVKIDFCSSCSYRYYDCIFLIGVVSYYIYFLSISIFSRLSFLVLCVDWISTYLSFI